MSVEQTSMLSWVELQPALGKRQDEVYFALQTLGIATDWEITKALGRNDPNYVRPRRKELYDLGLIRAVGKRPCTITKRTVLVWEIIKQRW